MFVHSFINEGILLFIYSFIHLFIHSFIHGCMSIPKPPSGLKCRTKQGLVQLCGTWSQRRCFNMVVNCCFKFRLIPSCSLCVALTVTKCMTNRAQTISHTQLPVIYSCHDPVCVVCVCVCVNVCIHSMCVCVLSVHAGVSVSLQVCVCECVPICVCVCVGVQRWGTLRSIIWRFEIPHHSPSTSLPA